MWFIFSKLKSEYLEIYIKKKKEWWHLSSCLKNKYGINSYTFLGTKNNYIFKVDQPNQCTKILNTWKNFIYQVAIQFC